jgi:hypothetical protein
MEADWEIEIGGGAPVIEAHWPGFVDLRVAPERARELAETDQLPGLADALALMNGTGSSMWTSKCDVFIPEEFDQDELDAPAESGLNALACYIDLLPRSDGRWRKSDKAVDGCRRICSLLHGISLRGCRVDLVIRRALLAAKGIGLKAEEVDLGVTAYVTACGASSGDAASLLERALAEFAEVIVAASSPA